MSDASIHSGMVLAAAVTFGLIVFAVFFMIPLAIYITHKRDVRRRRIERTTDYYADYDEYDTYPIYEREPVDAYRDPMHF